MYKYSKLPNTDYGVEGYETPVQHFDYLQKAQADQDWKRNIRGLKRKGGSVNKGAKRGGLNAEVEQRAKATPGPWTYDLKVDWIRGPRRKIAEEVPPKDKQAMKFKWKGVPKDDQEFKPRAKTARGKIDKNVETAHISGQKVLIY